MAALYIENCITPQCGVVFALGQVVVSED